MRTTALHTAHKSTRDPDAVDVTRQAGRTAFAPSWDLLLPFVHRRKATGRPATPAEWTAYATRYTDEMRASFHRDERAWRDLLARPRVVLTCFCADAAQCHRTILAHDILPRFATSDHAIVYHGELASAAAKRRAAEALVLPLFPDDVASDEPSTKTPETIRARDPYGRTPLTTACVTVADGEENGAAGFGIVIARRVGVDFIITAENAGRSPWGRVETARWADDLLRRTISGKCDPREFFGDATKTTPHDPVTGGPVFGRARRLACAYRAQARRDVPGQPELVDTETALRRYAAEMEDDVWHNADAVIAEVRREMGEEP